MFGFKTKQAQAQATLDELNQEIKHKQDEIADLNKSLTEAKQTIGVADGIIRMENLGVAYQPIYSTSSEAEKAINSTLIDIAYLLSQDKVITLTKSYRVDGSERKGETFQKSYVESLLMAFNAYVEAKKKNITTANIERNCDLIRSDFARKQKKAGLLGASISPKYLELKLQLIRYELDNKLAKAEEKEKIREEKRILREQEKLLSEAEKEKARLAKERLMYEQNLITALSEAQRQDFENKLAEIDKRIADTDYRVNNLRAGYLYVTSTPAMPGLIKLGSTKRLNPLVRLQELSSASVPFPFVCHALVFSDDVFTLEKNIHDYFGERRVNKQNLHKEFFEITADEAIKALKEEFGCEVHVMNEESEGEENDN